MSRPYNGLGQSTNRRNVTTQHVHRYAPTPPQANNNWRTRAKHGRQNAPTLAHAASKPMELERMQHRPTLTGATDMNLVLCEVSLELRWAHQTCTKGRPESWGESCACGGPA